MSPLDRAVEIRKVRNYLKSVETEIGELQIILRIALRYPFDIVGLATLSKAFAIAKACLKLLASDHPDEAHGLSRSLVEYATNLRYLTTDPSEQERRTRDFVKFAMADKAFWYHHALESAKSKKEKAELRAYAKQLGIIHNTRRLDNTGREKARDLSGVPQCLIILLTALSRWATGRRRMPWIITKPPRLCIAHYQRLIVITLMTAFRFAFRLPLAIMRPINQLCSSSLSMFTLLSAMCCLA